jgi:uncharacterized YccA/Bax inhibitor family protein
MRTANPALRDSAFRPAVAIDTDERMTILGTVHKTAILVTLALLSATYTWNLWFSGRADQVFTLVMVGVIGGLVAALFTIFVPRYAMAGSLAYAALEGLALGGISALFEQRYHGLPMQAVALTVFTLAALLFAYRSGLVQPTENFKLGVVAATGAIALLYLASLVLGFFGISMPLIHDNGLFGIGFSVVVVTVAALNLVLDFDFIERGAEAGAPKHLEWYGAFGLMLTLVWLYLEILRLLAKLNSRR